MTISDDPKFRTEVDNSPSSNETYIESTQADSRVYRSKQVESFNNLLDGNGGNSDSWVPIPPSLQNRFKHEKTLKRGGEATIYLVKDINNNNELVALKLYHREDAFNETVMEKLKAISESETDNPSVVRLIDWGITNDTNQRYEIQEYLNVGDLYDFIANNGQILEGRKRITPDSVLALMIISELFLAIKTVHAAGLSHHDIKPSNILVKEVSPHLDLVLADFGLTVHADSKIFLSKVMATIAYQSPESTGAGQGGPKRDYWAMGMTIAEVLTGRHPFADPQQPDTFLSDPAIKDHLYNKRPIDLSGVDSKRCHLLCEGLTRYNENNRWGETEVSAWLQGENPQVIPDNQGVENSTQTIGRMLFAGKLVGTREELAAVMSDEWRASAGMLNSEESRSKFLDQIAGIFGSEGIEELEAQWKINKPGIDRAVTDLICTLDPKSLKPVFRGYSVEQKDLAPLARSVASGDDKASRAVESLFDQGIFLPLSKLEGQSNLRNIDEQWHETVTKYDTIIKTASLNSVEVNFPRPVALAALLGAIADETFAATIVEDRNKAIEANPESKTFKWFNELCNADSNDIASLFASRILAKPADSVFREKQAIKDKERKAEEARVEKEQHEALDPLLRPLSMWLLLTIVTNGLVGIGLRFGHVYLSTLFSSGTTLSVWLQPLQPLLQHLYWIWPASALAAVVAAVTNIYLNRAFSLRAIRVTQFLATITTMVTIVLVPVGLIYAFHKRRQRLKAAYSTLRGWAIAGVSMMSVVPFGILYTTYNEPLARLESNLPSWSLRWYYDNWPRKLQPNTLYAHFNVDIPVGVILTLICLFGMWQSYEYGVQGSARLCLWVGALFGVSSFTILISPVLPAAIVGIVMVALGVGLAVGVIAVVCQMLQDM